MRIVALTNYSLDHAVKLNLEGEYPEHNLYGVRALSQDGHEVVCLGRRHASFLEQITEWSHGKLGELDQELQALRTSGATIFSGADETTIGLGVLRRCGLLRRPVACIVHHPPRRRMDRVAALGYDIVFTLSAFATASLTRLGRRPESTVTLRWGPDVRHSFYTQVPIRKQLVVSVGKSSRDFSTLRSALDGRKALIANSDRLRSYREALGDMAKASVVAIPYQRMDRMVGLTELNDALALGKPVIMTRSPHIDVDIEEIGCGIWVAPGDVAGWRRALQTLDNLRVARHMGELGREFVEREWNSEVCGRQIVAGLDRLTHAPAKGPR